MRILYVLHQFLPEFSAGTETVALNLAKAAQSAGHQVEVLTCAVHDPSLWAENEATGMRWAAVQGLAVHAIPGEWSTNLEQAGFGRSAATAAAAKRFLDSRAPYDVVHILHSLRMLEVAEAVRASGTPYILTLTDYFVDCYRINLVQADGAICAGPQGGAECMRACRLPEVEEPAMFARQARTRAVLEGAVSINACSDHLAEVLLNEHPDLHIRTVEHGLDLLRFDPRRPRRAGSNVVFGFLGTLSALKGASMLAQAFARTAPAPARLELVGPIYDEDFRQELAAIAADDPRITSRGPAPAEAIPEVLAGFDVLCLPSPWAETFSLVVHEGFAAGLPCIVSDIGWPARIVARAGCGAVARAGDVAAWSSAIAEVAASPALLDGWRVRIPLPRRVEEEGFIYDQLYRQAASTRAVPGGLA